MNMYVNPELHVRALERIVELERQVETLEWALTAAHTIAFAGLEVSRFVAERGDEMPEPNPLNGGGS